MGMRVRGRSTKVGNDRKFDNFASPGEAAFWDDPSCRQGPLSRMSLQITERSERRRPCNPEKDQVWPLFSETLSHREKRDIPMDGSCSLATISSRLSFAVMTRDGLALSAGKRRKVVRSRWHGSQVKESQKRQIRVYVRPRTCRARAMRPPM